MKHVSHNKLRLFKEIIMKISRFLWSDLVNGCLFKTAQHSFQLTYEINRNRNYDFQSRLTVNEVHFAAISTQHAERYPKVCGPISRSVFLPSVLCQRNLRCVFSYSRTIVTVKGLARLNWKAERRSEWELPIIYLEEQSRYGPVR